MTRGGRRRGRLALALFGVAMAGAAVTLVGVVAAGLPFEAAADSFLITNLAVGAGCAACGGLIAAYRTDHPLGWLLLGAGLAQTTTPLVTPWLFVALRDGWSSGWVRGLATVYSGAWPWSVSLFVPLAVLVFPNGRLPGLRWRGVLAVAVLNAPLQVLLFSADPNPLSAVRALGAAGQDRAASWLAVDSLLRSGWLELASDLTLGATYLAGFVGVAVRFRRADERTRRQLLWLLLAAALASATIVTSRLPGAISSGEFPVVLTTVIALVPVAMAIAVLRYQLLDIRLLWTRALTCAVLTVGVAVLYLLVIAAVGRPLVPRGGWGAPVLVTLVVAVALNPVRLWLQARVARLLYGDRSDAVRAASSVISQLGRGVERPTDVLPLICQALRVPYAQLSGPDGLLGSYGARPERWERFPLRHGGEVLGELAVGVRSGQAQLDRTDRSVLELVSVPLGVALRAEALSVAVQLSHRRIVAAREEERRRLRRDLHDGLGPVLTGVAFRADAVVSLADDDAARVRALGEDIRTDVTGAIGELRRLINQLRPAALEENGGLVDAVRRYAERLDRRADGSPLAVDVSVASELPALTAAIEAAAYRITAEALTNVARHSRATRAEVRMETDGSDLVVRVTDDGLPLSAAGTSAPWSPGVGLRSMHERAAELGGTVLAEPTDLGGRVLVRLPREG